MAIEEDRLRPKPPAHTVGEDLAVLSIDELGERIDVLRQEIARIEAAIAGKRAGAAAADAVFRL